MILIPIHSLEKRNAPLKKEKKEKDARPDRSLLLPGRRTHAQHTQNTKKRLENGSKLHWFVAARSAGGRVKTTGWWRTTESLGSVTVTLYT